MTLTSKQIRFVRNYVALWKDDNPEVNEQLLDLWVAWCNDNDIRGSTAEELLNKYTEELVATWQNTPPLFLNSSRGPETYPTAWEYINLTGNGGFELDRLMVPGGWLVSVHYQNDYHSALQFIADPNYEWKFAAK